MRAKPAFAVNPALGSPPSIEWIGVDRLAVDETYQRSCANPASEALISRIAAGWDWRLFQPLACARRAEGAIVVIDGQHRLLGARRRGDIPHLPCIIGQFESVADEAAAFAAMNRQRKSMTRLDLYRAQIAAGDPEAVEAMTVITGAGLSIARHTNPNNWKPGEIACIGGVAWCAKRYGPARTRRALAAIAGAYPGQKLTHAGTLLRPVTALASSEAFAQKLSIVVGRVTQPRWLEIGRTDGSSKHSEAAITERLSKLLSGDAQPASVTPPAKAAESWTPLPATPPKPRKTFEEELEAARNGTATFFERTIIPSRPPTELIGGSSLA